MHTFLTSTWVGILRRPPFENLILALHPVAFQLKKNSFEFEMHQEFGSDSATLSMFTQKYSKNIQDCSLNKPCKKERLK